MEVANVHVAVREERGRLQVNRVRDAGGIPAVIYGRGGENRSMTLPGNEFEKLVTTRHKLFELQFSDGDKEEAYLHDMQWDALRDEIVHVDFKRIDLNVKMTVEVALRFVGNAKGVSRNGVFEAPMQQVLVECLPANLPESIRINVNDLDLGDQILVKELPLPDGVAAVGDPDAVVCLCKAKTQNQEKDDGEGAEGEGGEDAGGDS